MDPVLYNELTTQEGKKADTASSTGSTHAKLNHLNEDTDAILAKDIVNHGSAIKSIQRGTISLSTSQLSNTASISSVTTSKSELRNLGVSCAPTWENVQSGAHGAGNVRITLTSGTTITATRDVHGSTAATVSYEVIEHY